MGLLKALFKKKAAASPPPDHATTRNSHAHTLEKPSVSDSAYSGDIPTVDNGILGGNPLDSYADISSTSLETVDYTHDEEDAFQAPSVPLNVKDSIVVRVASNGQPLPLELQSTAIEKEALSTPEADGDEHHHHHEHHHHDNDDRELEEKEILISSGDEIDAVAAIENAPLATSSPFQSMVYLTEDVENDDGDHDADNISVLSADDVGEGGSGSITQLQHRELSSLSAGDISELNRALETLEIEIPVTVSSPLAAAAAAAANSSSTTAAANDTREENSSQGAVQIINSNAAAASTSAAAAVVLGSSPGGSPSTASMNASPYVHAKNMVKLYNDLALKLMDAKEHTQALNLLQKAETLLDNDAAWVLLQVSSSDPLNASSSSYSYSNSSITGERGSGSLDSGSGSFKEIPNSTEEERAAANFRLSTQESSMDEAALAALTDADRLAAKRNRLRAITYNNIGCLYKRTDAAELALPYLHSALSLEEAAGHVHDCASTHLNLCAAYSALTRFKEALAHAERAILLLQRQLWGPSAASFPDGIAFLSRVLAALAVVVAEGPGNGGGNSGAADAEKAANFAAAHKRQRKLFSCANILAMAYHNAAVEHERLNRVREAQVSYLRACQIGTKFLGIKSSITLALIHAQKGFTARQQREAASGDGGGPLGGGGGNRKTPSTISMSSSRSNNASSHLTGGGGGGGGGGLRVKQTGGASSSKRVTVGASSSSRSGGVSHTSRAGKTSGLSGSASSSKLSGRDRR